jgi:hypothetical protein
MSHFLGGVTLKVLIVGDKYGQRIKPLLSIFSNDNRFDIEFWEPVYLKSFFDEQLVKSGFNVNKSTSYMSRRLSLNEIGCALAHIRAREYLATLEFGGVILEDDARIPNLDYFFRSATLFLDTIKTPSVLNFSSIRTLEDFGDFLPEWPTLQKQISHSPLNVGYVLNKPGAIMLSTTKYRQFMMNDWPYSNINKYVLTNPAVAHGDAANLSTIDPENRLNRSTRSWRRSWPNRMRLFSFYWYLRHRSNFTSLKEYIVVMLIPRILYQFHSFSPRFRRIRIK